MSSDKLDTAALAEVLAYLLENEQQHYEESGKPDDHIYAKALHCALQLQRIEDLALRLGIIEQEDLPEPEDMDD